MPSVKKTPDGCLAACRHWKNDPTGAWQHAIGGKITQRVLVTVQSLEK
jgi:hypothetical protein